MGSGNGEKKDMKSLCSLASYSPACMLFFPLRYSYSRDSGVCITDSDCGVDVFCADCHSPCLPARILDKKR